MLKPSQVLMNEQYFINDELNINQWLTKAKEVS